MSDQLADVRSFRNFGVKRLINCLRFSVTTDNLVSHPDHNDNRRYADAPLSGRLCLRVPRRVRYVQPALPFILLNACNLVSGLPRRRITNYQ
jgi:hypothetical protein